MDVNDARVQMVAQQLQRTLSPDSSVRQAAEQVLVNEENNPNYGIVLLTLVSSDVFPMEIRTSGSIYFKNFIKRNWIPDDGAPNKINDVERNAIRTHVVNLMLRSPEQVQRQLSDAISVIGRSDFPEKWPTLLDELVSFITKDSTDFYVINGVLQTAHSLFKRYRHEFKSQKLWTEIRFVIDTFAKPFTALFVKTVDLANVHSNNRDALKVIFGSLALCAKIFYSLNVQDLPDIIEDNLPLWMKNFIYLLTVNNTLLTTDTDEEVGVVEQLKAQVCEVASLYASKYSEEFQTYLPQFVENVWLLLKTTGPQVKYDLLVSISMKFLTTVASRPANKSLFQVPGILDQICSNIIIPNMVFRDSDEELFEDNPEEFIKQDMEGSDVDTRRRAACDLVKALSNDFEPQITVVFYQYIQQMLQEYEANPTGKWRNKDAAVYLITSMAVKGSTARQGTTSTSELVNVVDFYTNCIKPELTRPDLNQFPVLKASGLKYLVTFRNQLPHDILIDSFPLIITHLNASSMVIHTYAANAIEKLLSVKNTSGLYLINQEVLTPMADVTFKGLFSIFSKPGSEQNDYAMKGILKTIASLQSSVAPYLESVLSQTFVKLNEVCRNPTKPHFNHYLFETIALSIKIACDSNRESLPSFEQMIFPVANLILFQNIAEFTPYIFQILSQLLEYHVIASVPVAYNQLFELFLTPDLWDKNANIQPMTRFLLAFIKRASDHIISMGKMAPLLGVFQKLIASKNNDHHGFAILRTITLHSPANIITQYLEEILRILFLRLTNTKTPQFASGLITFLCLFAYKFRPQSLVDAINSVQNGMFDMVIERLFLTDLIRVSGKLDRKITIIGIATILSDHPNAMGPTNPLWKQLFAALMSLLELTPGSVCNEDEISIEKIDSSLEASGYQASFAQLVYAKKEPENIFDGVVGLDDGEKVYLARVLAQFSRQNPGILQRIIPETLSSQQTELLQKCFTFAGEQIS